MDETGKERRGSEVTPERDCVGVTAPRRAKRRLETDESDDANTTSERHGVCRQEEINKAHQLSEGIIELLHVCTLIQVEMNNNPSSEAGRKHQGY